MNNEVDIVRVVIIAIVEGFEPGFLVVLSQFTKLLA